VAASPRPTLWLAAGVRTPFARVDGPLAALDAIELSVPVVRHMLGELRGALPDFVVWGSVVPNLTYSNIAREVLMDAGAPATIPAFSTVMACSTSMVAAIEASGMLNGVDRTLALVGGAESLSRIQLGLGQSLSDWIRRVTQARSLGDKVSHVTDLRLGDVKLYIPSVSNRTTGKSMGEHTEITAREWSVPRREQDEIALASHRNAVAARDRAFFDDLVIATGAAPRTLPQLERFENAISLRGLEDTRRLREELVPGSHLVIVVWRDDNLVLAVSGSGVLDAGDVRALASLVRARADG